MSVDQLTKKTSSSYSLWGGARNDIFPYVLSSQFNNSYNLSLIVVKDALHLQNTLQLLQFFAPESTYFTVPAWDSHPFENMSPDSHIAALRAANLGKLSLTKEIKKPIVVLTTIRSLLQKVPPATQLQSACILLKKQAKIADELQRFLLAYGFERVEIVRNPGEYALRGSLVDIFSPAESLPIRCDFFGDTIESLHFFDPVKQLRLEAIEQVHLFAASELRIDEATKTNFQRKYFRRSKELQRKENKTLCLQIEEGKRPDGIEYWLGYFYPKLESFVDFLRSIDPELQMFFQENVNADDLFHDLGEMHQNQQHIQESEETLSFPEIDSLYVSISEWDKILKSFAKGRIIQLRKEQTPNPDDAGEWLGSTYSKMSPDFTTIRNEGQDVYKHLINLLKDLVRNKKQVLLTFDNTKTLTRVQKLLRAYELLNVAVVKDNSEWQRLDKRMIAMAHIVLERGFEVDDVVVISQSDILGSVKKREHRKDAKSKVSLVDTNVLRIGETVVHSQYGIGRYRGMEEHIFDHQKIACLRIVYQGGDSILLPVYNLDMISRYSHGTVASDTPLDKLGGTAWQARKLRAQKKIMEMAEALLQTEAKRKTIRTKSYSTRDEIYYEFCMFFPHVETPDQEKAEEDILADLAKSEPMDRLICGDVGFGKTEIALRAGFVVASNGDQVALIAPTTLLAHQHFRTAKERFEKFGIKVEVLSRFVPTKQAKIIKERLASGDIDIIIGTHTLLGSSVQLKRVGLVVLDEEQLFGVSQKEKLKRWNTQTHVLTMSATPIPRTLQMSLSGVKDISLIATPPVNRHAIRTYIATESDMTIRRAILDEIKRKGQVYFICPRVHELHQIAEKVAELVPEARYVTTHGQMNASQIEKTMLDFIGHKVDVLIATPIVGAGLDVANANTMIVYKSHMFGLAQLYQLRGRVGRSGAIAHCYLFLPNNMEVSDIARKRLDVIRTNDSLGMGFHIANHDLDLRGAGNLLGGEQSGHIKEVGAALYQKMLAETVAHMQNDTGEPLEEQWSAQVRLGFDAYIPESYIPDVSVRLQLYNELNEAQSAIAIAQIKEDFIDRFGKLPKPVHGLLHVMAVRVKCHALHIEKLNAHALGLTIKFKNNRFSQPEKLLQFLDQQRNNIRADAKHQLNGKYDWQSDAKRLRGINRILDELQNLVDV